ncbi:hypothetical protein LTR56_027536 [Elasticomyces elasticus]|nr:hypothetical protein LTR22_027932 [Elasticomyces elasticus]KAK3614011.1 hypothetical protein LTR56_027536 [Elasticomyces elasticus]KAK4900146.1 hypothetical protein LTR49_027524 [Elasticomyces elasticus]KAK5746736.1 hypothetical protein LTS12_022633 [Elasticomyces elasticus]
MAIGDGNKTPWSDIEKLSVLFQIMEQVGKIDWDAITLPADRTLTGAKRMICKEKDKVKKAGAGAVGDEPASPTKKRTASTKTDSESSESPEKKTKRRAPRKNAKKTKVASEEAAGEDEDAETVKAEPAEEDAF